ncbi:hypothetical protein OWM54_40330 [Myxococcus sp. MISCRS1]|uniref:hypothetical protein n=1 Tax=unclassified Myxococcus TaxID=2648731 RepID=UPI001CBA9D93|nr:MULTISPECIES: hypothetical protein [unclassified Myxococcus]MBZ4398068.1 hypothetical protein [Myxococcus sp. AS-1-15]MBZ4409248.1 hypothetical protein [Myxococcus sp. XM-1-1-1]MCY1003413.1 hypothetical protein [Myxococcus sp. MISCRS1]BDT34977.1 hypothetical protein MFMH1_46460 [Myxococcus sp. MH1]
MALPARHPESLEGFDAMLNKAFVVLALVFISGLEASVFCYSLWGYFITPPSGAGVLAASRRLEALTSFRSDPNGDVELRPTQPIVPSEFIGCPLFDFTSRCMHDRLMAAVITLPGDLSRTESVEELRPQIESVCGNWASSRRGKAITVQGDSGQMRLITCTSGELSNDLFAYREVLFTQGEEKEIASIEYEVSGSEFLTMPFFFTYLLPFNICLYVIGRVAGRQWYGPPLPAAEGGLPTVT